MCKGSNTSADGRSKGQPRPGTMAMGTTEGTRGGALTQGHDKAAGEASKKPGGQTADTKGKADGSEESRSTSKGRDEGRRGSREARAQGRRGSRQRGNKREGGWGAEGRTWGTQGQGEGTSRGPRGSRQRQAKRGHLQESARAQTVPASAPPSVTPRGGWGYRQAHDARAGRCGTNKQRKGNETGEGLVLPTAARRAGHRARKWQNPAERLPHSTASQQRPSPKEPLR